jgi:hypothetical protein
LLLLLGAAALAGTSCGGLSRQDALDELTGVGYEAESAECVIASVEDQGYEAGDLADPVSAEVQTALESAIDGCITAADAVGVSENLGEEELRAEVIADLVGDGMAPDQAECIISSVEGAGFTVLDLAKLGLEEPGTEAVLTALQDASASCATG